MILKYQSVITPSTRRLSIDRVGCLYSRCNAVKTRCLYIFNAICRNYVSLFFRYRTELIPCFVVERPFKNNNGSVYIAHFPLKSHTFSVHGYSKSTFLNSARMNHIHPVGCFDSVHFVSFEFCMFSLYLKQFRHIRSLCLQFNSKPTPAYAYTPKIIPF